MNKVYIIGFKYDNFSGEGFEVKTVASTVEKAEAIKSYYEKRDSENFYEIQEWDIDILNPAKEIVQHSTKISTVELLNCSVLPYKIIK